MNKEEYIKANREMEFEDAKSWICMFLGSVVCIPIFVFILYIFSPEVETFVAARNFILKLLGCIFGGVFIGGSFGAALYQMKKQEIAK